MHSTRRCWRHATRGSETFSFKHVIHRRSLHNVNALISDAPEAEGVQHGGVLNGKAIAVKDNIVTSDLPTTAASKILSNQSSPFEATVVKLLRQNGARISSKTNLDEFGMGSHSQHSHHGPVLNHYTRNGIPLSPGGSSGGSAVAVARGQCWAALGTDTGGSVRLPAAYAGIVGFKPSYGLLSRWGVIQYANSLDTVGVLAKNVQDATMVFEVLNQYDARDPTSLPPSLRGRIRDKRSSEAKGSLRIGVPMEYLINELSPAVRTKYVKTLESLQNQGHRIVPVSLPTTRQALPAYYVLAPAEASSNLAKYDGIRYGLGSEGPDAVPKENLPLYAKTRGQGFGPEVQRRILLGAYTLSSEAMDNYFIQAQKVRRLVQRDFDRVFAMQNPLVDTSDEHRQADGVDVLLTPTAPTLPPTVEEVKAQTPVESYRNDIFTVPASLAGLPAASVSVALSDAVRGRMEDTDVKTVGMQVIGQFGDDEVVLAAASIVEKTV